MTVYQEIVNEILKDLSNRKGFQIIDQLYQDDYVIYHEMVSELQETVCSIIRNRLEAE